LINSVFNSVIVLGAAFFADYDNFLPLEEGITKAERFLGLFVPHDPHACRFFQIIKYLRGAVAEYVSRRNRQWMDRRSKQVDQLFGQVGGGKDPCSPTPGTGHDISPHDRPNDDPLSAAVPSPTSPGKLAGGTLSSFLTPRQPQFSASDDVWDTLYNSTNEAAALSYDAAISALTTSGIPVGCSPGGTIPSGQQAMPGGPSPLSGVIFPDNGLLYMAEDLPNFGIWPEDP
jgi:hypothetical protein